VRTLAENRGALIELRSSCNQIHAFVYRYGTRIGHLKLAEGTEVWRASKADGVHMPKRVPRFAAAVKNAPEFSGWYIVPDEGFSAVFGAKPHPEKRKPGRPKRLMPPTETVVALKGSRAWKTWLDKFVAHCGSGLAGTIEQALEHYAELREFKGPPKR
jgi:hypothetical protein